MLKVKFILAFFILLLLSNNKVYAEIYQWTDENGVIRFSDSVPHETETLSKVEQLPMETVEYDQEESDSSDTDRFDFYDSFSGHTLYRISYKHNDHKFKRRTERLKDVLIDHLYQDGFSKVSVNDINTFDYWHEKVTQEILSSDHASVYMGGPSGFCPVYVVFTYNDDGEKNNKEAYPYVIIQAKSKKFTRKAKIVEIIL